MKKAADHRSPGWDQLKAWTTLLVVFHHTAITYGGAGGWFYKEVPPAIAGPGLLLTIFCAVNQAWFMGLFFLLAGRFTPPAIRRKGRWRFLRDRLLRLGLPWLVFGWLIGPATVALARTADGRGFIDTLLAVWRHGGFEPGPMWFAQALLMFSAAAVLWPWAGAAPRAATPATTAGQIPAPTPAPTPVQTPTPTPTPTPAQTAARTAAQIAAQTEAQTAAHAPAAMPSHRALLLAALGCAAAAFALRLVWPVGTEVWHLQLGYFAGYVLLFAVGGLSAQRGWFERLPEPLARHWRRVAWCVLPTLLPLAVLSAHVPLFAGNPNGGWTLPAAMYALWEPFVAWGVLLALLLRFGRAHKVWPAWRQALARRAYAIFVIHPPVVVAVCLAWRGVAAPALLKFAVSGTLACVLCHVLADLLLRVRGMQRVL